jgi:lipoate-protein ligase A
MATLPGDVVSLGRFHLVPPAARDDGTLWRRASGGRVVPCGDGFVVLSLTLPHRSALESNDSYALQPEQVMNRCVRGLLDGLAALGVSALYPGRDTVTAGGRPLALVSFDVDADGALLFEAVVSVERDWSVLATVLDRADPGGIARASLVLPGAATSIARELGHPVELGDVVAALQRGYAARLRCEVADRPAPAAAGDAEAWLRARVPRPELDRHGWSPTMLGALDVHLATGGGVLREVMLSGDLIAPAPTIASLEAALRGCPATRDAVQALVSRVFSAPEAFVLGIGPVTTITDTVMRAVGA